MIEQTYKTSCGEIHYWVNKNADHRLFRKQTEYFEGKYPVFVWDAPGHAASWPFKFEFDLMDKAGSCIRYNKKWHEETGIPIEWISGAGHNSNTDAPVIVNRLIESLVKTV